MVEQFIVDENERGVHCILVDGNSIKNHAGRSGSKLGRSVDRIQLPGDNTYTPITTI